MKKMLVFREGICPDSREVDDYLHDSEVIRGEYIDLSPEEETRRFSGTLALYDSTWQVIFKGDHEFDQWHVVGEASCPYAFEEPAYKAATGLLEPYRDRLVLTAVLHKRTTIVLVYRVPKPLSELINLHLPFILEGFVSGVYTYVIPELDLGATDPPEPKEKVTEGPPVKGT